MTVKSSANHPASCLSLKRIGMSFSLAPARNCWFGEHNAFLSKLVCNESRHASVNNLDRSYTIRLLAWKQVNRLKCQNYSTKEHTCKVIQDRWIGSCSSPQRRVNQLEWWMWRSQRKQFVVFIATAVSEAQESSHLLHGTQLYKNFEVMGYLNTN